MRPGWGETTAGCRLCRLSVRAVERVDTVYDLCKVYNPFEWSVSMVWTGYGVVLTTSELPTVGRVGKGLHTISCIANALCSMCVVHVISPPVG